jgi:hypothetical protein
MQKVAFPGFKFQKFSRGHAPEPPRLRGASSFWDYATVRFLAGSAPDGFVSKARVSACMYFLVYFILYSF